ncbi:hypothetical protein PR003_g6568 [Phytophthora rubi]|uniref:Uncharacterized protein n=1 Tax=Phytophthora rubi TaxID=129364 RepID=A0A6A3MQI7_9STRA|nr:hypothetical protein PR002_g9621 [Phytophthora rubi]KAE9042274.1 hypothetical protein PR001_g6249 [Phytophthora rubi]KAE9348120.1 hypothetical protein PR003_g6568 [Phytophthora rubi]
MWYHIFCVSALLCVCFYGSVVRLDTLDRERTASSRLVWPRLPAKSPTMHGTVHSPRASKKSGARCTRAVHVPVLITRRGTSSAGARYHFQCII